MKTRNVAIIAHVDHGKTTLVDALLRQSLTHLSKEQAGEDCIMDSNELERERGITIFSKNASVHWKDTKINIIDTPGHADFGGEVERVLSMADGALLLVDAKEGPMPQTRFVLKRALERGLRVLVVINKIDKTEGRPDVALNRTFDLFVELGADDHQADFPIIYASGRDGKAGLEPNLAAMTDITPIFEAILKHVPAPSGNPSEPLQMLISSLAADNFKGKIGIGRIYNGTIKASQQVAHMTRDGKTHTAKLLALMSFEGLGRVEVEQAEAGDIVAVAGIDDIGIGETVGDPDDPRPLPLLAIEQPTVKMTFMVNDSPFAGREGQFTTSRQIRARLYKELETDMALRIDDNPDGTWTVSGRGELHLAILIERLRREGYELQVSRPQVINHTIDGKEHTPYERVHIEVPEAYYGSVMQKLGSRNGELTHMHQDHGIVNLEFVIPTRGLFGYRSEFVMDTKGLGIFNSTFLDYRRDPGKWKDRERGSLIAFESGETVSFGLAKIQDRGQLFFGPGVPVYKGMVVGQCARDEDIRVNVCKEKHLTNMRSKGDGVWDQMHAPRLMDLEDAIEYIGEDELVEATPKSVRIRKRILDESEYRRKMVHGINS